MNMMVKKGRKSDISVLGEELLVDILCRLGCVKSATQCKSVCKLWRSLVKNDSYWLRRWHQMNHKIQSVTLITDHEGGTATTIDYCGKETPTNICVALDFLPYFTRKNTVHVLGSYKDLLLCCPKDSDHSYYICNPLTKQWTALPPPPPLGQLTDINQRTQVEFIVDERVDGGVNFTVVRVTPYRDETVQVCVFSSDGGWREVDDGGDWREMFLAERSCKKMVSYNGSLVWLMTKEFSAEEEVRLYSWDLRSNCARLPLILPGYPTNGSPGSRSTGTYTIGVFEGRLLMVQLLHDRKKLIVWQFDDNKKWDMLQELELDLRPLLMEHKVRDYKALTIQTKDVAFHPHDEDILYIHVNTLYLYVDTASYEERRVVGSSSYIFKYNLQRRRLELMRYLPVRIVEGAKLVPLVNNCWPTPVPRLQL